MEQLQELLQRPETIQKVNALQERAAKELFSWPVLTGKERLKRGIRRFLLFQKLPPVDHYFWPNALLAGGLSEILHGVWDNRSEKTLIRYFDRWQKSGMRLYYVDNAANGMPLLDLYESTGEKKYLDAADRLAEFLLQQPGNEKGQIPYRRRDPFDIYADGIGMICPFLCRYGVLTQKEEAVKLGVMQMVRFLDLGMEETSGLPYHGFNSETQVKYGCVGWGRAVGWLMTGLAESLAYLPEKTPQFSFLREKLSRLAERVCTLQRPDGSFSWLLPATQGPADSSATAMTACALLRGMQSGCLEVSYVEPVRRAAEFLLSCMKNGGVEQCSAECLGFGEYPQRYGCYPWGDGAALKLFGMIESGSDWDGK